MYTDNLQREHMMRDMLIRALYRKLPKPEAMPMSDELRQIRKLETETVFSALSQIRERNPERIKDWSKWFHGLRQTVHELRAHSSRKPKNPAASAKLGRLLAMIDRAEDLLLMRLTTFMIFELPQWVAQEIAREFPDQVGERFAASLRDVSPDGFVTKDPLGDTVREVKDLIA